MGQSDDIQHLQSRANPDKHWLSAADLKALTPQSLTARTEGLKGLLSENARRAEMARHPVDAVWDEIRKTGVFYHFVPKCYGGLEFDVQSFIDAMLPLSEGCSSTGWVTAFCVEHNWLLTQFPKQAQDEIFGSHPYVIAPGVTNPMGRAKAVDGGFLLSGQWRWGTGVMHSDWIMAYGAIASAEGPPQIRFFIFPTSEGRIVDNWHVDGMCGTGSHDVVADQVFIPEHRSFEVAGLRDGRGNGAALYDNPIYRMPMMPFLALTAAIPAIGTARAAVAHFKSYMSERQVYLTDLKQSDKPASQMRLGHADMQARTAEMLVRDAGHKIMQMANQIEAPTAEQRVAVRMQIAYAMDLCRNVISLASAASGSSAHFVTNPIQRALRDINVMSSHVVYDLDSVSELHGRALVGLPMNSPLV